MQRLTPVQLQRKIDKLHRMHLQLRQEARNYALSNADRAHLARAADALAMAVKAMEDARC